MHLSKEHLRIFTFFSLIYFWTEHPFWSLMWNIAGVFCVMDPCILNLQWKFDGDVRMAARVVSHRLQGHWPQTEETSHLAFSMMHEEIICYCSTLSVCVPACLCISLSLSLSLSLWLSLSLRLSLSLFLYIYLCLSLSPLFCLLYIFACLCVFPSLFLSVSCLSLLFSLCLCLYPSPHFHDYCNINQILIIMVVCSFCFHCTVVWTLWFDCDACCMWNS